MCPKVIDTNSIVSVIADNISHCLKNVESSVCNLLSCAEKSETNQTAKWALSQLVLNNQVAAKDNLYACQDCGQAVIFADIGTNIKLDGNITNALNSAVQLGYANARKSVAHPLTRLNTKTNTPAIIHYDFVEGNTLTITYLAKGAGSENMSRVYMLTPSKGEQGIIDSVVDCVVKAGANPCPPLVIGVGIGGTMEKCALLSKRALTRQTAAPSDIALEQQLEQKILNAVNATNIGAQGFGGVNTALAVHVLTHPTHIGMLPVAVNLQCHSVRHFSLKF